MDQPAGNSDCDEHFLGVHVLTEFVYCPRAGIVAHAKGGPDAGDELQREPWASLSYLPMYDVSAINKSIRRNKSRSLLWSALSLALLVAACVSFFRLGIGWLVVALAAYLSCMHAVVCLLDLAQDIWLRWHVLNDKEKEPDPTCFKDQAVNWWAMFRADFDSVPYNEGPGLKSEELLLAGRPWRVLRRGSMRIPVFKKRHSNKPDGHKLHPQHYVRIAAYCRLIEESERAESPYGIVLFDDSYTGVAINALDLEQRMTLANALERARETIRSNRDEQAPKPKPPSTCKGCPIGRPLVHRPGETDTLRRGIALPIFGAIGRDGRTYHSACGDHFRWIPPHVRVAEKGLKQVSTELASQPSHQPG